MNSRPTMFLPLAAAVGVFLTGCATFNQAAPPPPPQPTPDLSASALDHQPGSPDPITPEASYTPSRNPSATPTPGIPSPTLSAGAKGTARGQRDASQVDVADPDQVAMAFAEALVAVDAKLDHRPNDAGARAAVWADNELAATMIASAPIAAPGARWAEISRREGWTTVSTAPANTIDAPPDQEGEVWRAVTTESTPADASGWTGTTETVTWQMQLWESDGRWAVSDYEVLR